MTTRALLLACLVAVLALPAAALADDGGSSGSTPATAAGAHKGSVLGARMRARAGMRVSRQLERRYGAFEKHCLVADAPDRCAKAAERAVRRIDALTKRLQSLGDKLTARCAAASPPKACANLATLKQRLDEALAKLAAARTAITARYPAAGGA